MLSQEEGQARGGSAFSPKSAAPRLTAWSETFGRITTNYNMPHPHYMGRHHVCAAMQCSVIPQSPDDWPCRRYKRPTTRCTHHGWCKPGPRDGDGGPQTTSPWFYFEERMCKRGCAKRELSDYTFLGKEKIHKNNFRVSLPRCRAVRSWG